MSGLLPLPRPPEERNKEHGARLLKTKRSYALICFGFPKLCQTSMPDAHLYSFEVWATVDEKPPWAAAVTSSNRMRLRIQDANPGDGFVNDE